MKGTWQLDNITAALSSAAHAAAQTAVKVSKKVATEVVGAECLLQYQLEDRPTATCGPLWSIYLARSKKEGAQTAVVSAWVMDKRSINGGTNANDRSAHKRMEAVIDLCRRDVQHLVRLKHPSIVRLISPLEETRTQLVFITEAVSCSLADMNLQQADILSELEIKHGIIQVCEGLNFLHQTGLVHRAISPESIVITRSGGWKVAGFGFASPLTTASSPANCFDYSDRHPSTLGLALLPPLSYTAPETIATGRGCAVLPSADVFSMALVAFELLSRRPLLPKSCSLIDYEGRMKTMQKNNDAFHGAPAAVVPLIRQIISQAPEYRPSINSFSECVFFQGDIHLRALKFLDNILQKSVEQRAAFLHDLPGMAASFDRRVLLYNVLPPLLQELRNKDLQSTTLPIILTILKVQNSDEFIDTTLPSIEPLLEIATGEVLLQLTQAIPLFQTALGGKKGAHVRLLVPRMVVRALESQDARNQEEALKQMVTLADTLDYEGLKKEILPSVHATCLSTTVASIRVSAFKALASVIGRVDAAEGEQMLLTATTILSVDKSAPTAMCVVGLGDALAKKWGPTLAAEKVLPAISPLLVAPSLSSQQFATTAKAVRDIVALVEKSRGDGSSTINEGNFTAPRNENRICWKGDASDQPLAQSASTTATPVPASRPGNAPVATTTTMNLKMPGIKLSSPRSSSNNYMTKSNATTSAHDPFDWSLQPPPSRPAVTDPLAGLFASSTQTNNVMNKGGKGGMKLRKASQAAGGMATDGVAFDPFDDLALQHSTMPQDQSLI